MSDTVKTVLATLRVLAEQLRSDHDRATVEGIAEQLAQQGLDSDCCPLCQEVTCDEGCPLQVNRAIAAQEPCGFEHDQWDGPYKMSRRCIAKAGHTTGQFAYDHGPWESTR